MHVIIPSVSSVWNIIAHSFILAVDAKPNVVKLSL